MEANQSPASGINAWLEEELLQQYHHDRTSVDSDWKEIFEHEPDGGHAGNGHGSVAVAAPAVVVHEASEPVLTGSEELMPLRGTAARIAENMALSASIPLATSQRIVPVKVIDEN